MKISRHQRLRSPLSPSAQGFFSLKLLKNSPSFRSSSIWPSNSLGNKADPGTSFIQFFEGIFSDEVDFCVGFLSKLGKIIGSFVQVIGETNFLCLKHCNPGKEILLALVSLRWWSFLI